MKKLLSVVLVMLLAVGMTGCGSSSNGKTELLIGVSPDYPPYESYNNKKEVVGFDVDMTKELVKIMNKNGGNYSYKFKPLSFDAISSSITSNQVDLGISGFTYHKEWKNILWSHAYNTSEQIALVKGDSTFSKVSDLEGKKIGAQLGSTGVDAAKDIKGAQVTTVQNAKILVETLKSGGLDSVVLDGAVAENYVKNAGLKMIDEPLIKEENMIITKKGNDKLMKDVNKAVDEFVKSDKYNELKTKWGC
mgnify:FL=1|jgi:ABC-type amino acid transport substrate-binding protein